MTDFLASLSLWTGVALGVLKFLDDWALSDQQKKWITDRAISLFVWLDDQREPKYLRYLGKFRWQIIVIILYAALALVMLLIVAYGMYTEEASKVEEPRGIFHILLGGYVGSFLAALLMVRMHPYVFNWVTKTEGSGAYIGRSTLALLATLLVTIAVSLVYAIVESKMYAPPSDLSTNPERFVEEFFGQRDVYYLLITSTALMFALTIAFLMLVSWLLVVIPVVFVLLLMFLLRVVQLVTARIAESPKGPVLALSGLLAAVGAVAKFFV
jgi:hypothetical protein